MAPDLIASTASFGVAALSQGAAKPEDLLDRADKALYRSKSSGRNRVSAWNLQPDAGASTLQGDFIPGISRSDRAEAAASPEPSPSDTGVLLPEHDSLTGLPNRSVFSEYLSRAIGRAERKSSPLAVLFVDLDRFKRINDGLGHAAGDRALREVVKVVQGILPPGALFARLGGEEFLVILNETDIDGAMLLAEKVRASVEEMR
mgnify:CR=1 FL=1